MRNRLRCFRRQPQQVDTSAHTRKFRHTHEILSQDLDPEEIHPHSDSDSHENNAAAKEHYLQVGSVTILPCYRCHQFITSPDRPSAIRQANAALSDPKYLGTRVSRADLDADSEQGDSENNNSADEAESSESDLSSQESEQNDDGGEVEHRRHVVQHASTSVGAGEEDTQRPQKASTSDLASALRATREQDRRKGKAVVRQIVSGRVHTRTLLFSQLIHIDRHYGTRCSMRVSVCKKAQLR